MNIHETLELSMILDTDDFQRVFTNKAVYMKEFDSEYIDTSLETKGITVFFRDSRYKKKTRLLVNASLVVGGVSDTSKLICKLDKWIAEYFDHKYGLDDFTLSGTNLTLDINLYSRENVSDYLKVLRRVGKVKGFSPASYECFDEKTSFCLSGNSNGIDFLLYDLERAVVGQLRSEDAGRKQLQSASEQTKGLLRAEVRLTKPKAVREYADATDISSQIVEMMTNSKDAFMDTFARAVPFGDFYKIGAAVKIIRQNVKDPRLQRRMLRLIDLIPKKKSLLLAQKAMNYREPDKLLIAFAEIGLSPITISKRGDTTHLPNIYFYLDK